MASQNGTNVALSTFKVYIFPTLVSILAMMIWRDINEMRADIKALLAQSNVDKTKIEQLERTVKSLEMSVYDKKPVASAHYPWFMRLYFKPEDYYYINEHIISETNES